MRNSLVVKLRREAMNRIYAAQQNTNAEVHYEELTAPEYILPEMLDEASGFALAEVAPRPEQRTRWATRKVLRDQEDTGRREVSYKNPATGKWVIQAYLFDKKKWGESEIQQWLKGKGVHDYSLSGYEKGSADESLDSERAALREKFNSRQRELQDAHNAKLRALQKTHGAGTEAYANAKARAEASLKEALDRLLGERDEAINALYKKHESLDEDLAFAGVGEPREKASDARQRLSDEFDRQLASLRKKFGKKQPEPEDDEELYESLIQEDIFDDEFWTAWRQEIRAVSRGDNVSETDVQRNLPGMIEAVRTLGDKPDDRDIKEAAYLAARELGFSSTKARAMTESLEEALVPISPAEFWAVIVSTYNVASKYYAALMLGKGLTLLQAKILLIAVSVCGFLVIVGGLWTIREFIPWVYRKVKLRTINVDKVIWPGSSAVDRRILQFLDPGQEYQFKVDAPTRLAYKFTAPPATLRRGRAFHFIGFATPRWMGLENFLMIVPAVGPLQGEERLVQLKYIPKIVDLDGEPLGGKAEDV